VKLRGNFPSSSLEAITYHIAGLGCFPIFKRANWAITWLVKVQYITKEGCPRAIIFRISSPVLETGPHRISSSVLETGHFPNDRIQHSCGIQRGRDSKQLLMEPCQILLTCCSRQVFLKVLQIDNLKESAHVGLHRVASGPHRTPGCPLRGRIGPEV